MRKITTIISGIIALRGRAEAGDHRGPPIAYLSILQDGRSAAKGTEFTYAPSALLNIFNNSLNIQQSKKLVRSKAFICRGKAGTVIGTTMTRYVIKVDKAMEIFN